MHTAQLGLTLMQSVSAVLTACDPGTRLMAVDVAAHPCLGGGNSISPVNIRGYEISPSAQMSGREVGGHTESAHPHASWVCTLTGDFHTSTAWWLPHFAAPPGSFLLPGRHMLGPDIECSQLALPGKDSRGVIVLSASLARCLSSSLPPPSPQMERDTYSGFCLKPGPPALTSPVMG